MWVLCDSCASTSSIARCDLHKVCVLEKAAADSGAEVDTGAGTQSVREVALCAFDVSNARRTFRIHLWLNIIDAKIPMLFGVDAGRMLGLHAYPIRFNGAGEKIDGRMIDGLRVSIQETIENSGSHQQQSKKQKKGEGGPSGVKP